jgi:glutamyl-tRNA synthetase
MKFTKGDTVVSLEKLWFLQKRHAARYASIQPPKPANPSHDLEELAVKPIANAIDRRIRRNVDRYPCYTAIPEGSAQFDFIRAILWADAHNYTSPDDFIFRHLYFFTEPPRLALSHSRYDLTLPNLPPTVNNVDPTTFLAMFQPVHDVPQQDWNKNELKARIMDIIDRGAAGTLEELKRAEDTLGYPDLESIASKAWGRLVHGYIRWAIMARKPGPNGADTMAILGRTESLKRLQLAEEILRNEVKKDIMDEAEL